MIGVAYLICDFVVTGGLGASGPKFLVAKKNVFFFFSNDKCFLLWSNKIYNLTPEGTGSI